MAQNRSQDEQTPLGNAIFKLKIFSSKGSKPLEYDPKGSSIILSGDSKSTLETNTCLFISVRIRFQSEYFVN